MMSFIEWVAYDYNKKKKAKKHEQRSNQTHGESGNDDQQGQVDRGDPQISQQTIHVFPITER
jgi:hypothetical protein